MNGNDRMDPSDPLKVMEDADDFEKRMEEIDELLPLEYRYPKTYRPRTPGYRAGSVPPSRASSIPPSRASSVPPLSTAPFRSITPLRTYTPPPRQQSEKVGYSYSGDPLWWDYPLRSSYKSLDYGRTPYYLHNYLNSSYTSPTKLSYIRSLNTSSDPWWWDYPSRTSYKSLYYPYYLRSNYVSPLRRSNLWSLSRPFSHPWWWDYPTIRPHYKTIYHVRTSVRTPKTYGNSRWPVTSSYWV